MKDKNKKFHFDNIDYDWTTFWNVMFTINRIYISNFRENHNYAFIIKFTNDLLPTMSILNTRKLNIYKNCFCILYSKRCTKNMQHLIRCFKLMTQWEQAELQTSIELDKFIKKKFKDNANVIVDLDIIKTILFPKFNRNRKTLKISMQRYNRWKVF